MIPLNLQSILQEEMIFLNTKMPMFMIVPSVIFHIVIEEELFIIIVIKKPQNFILNYVIFTIVVVHLMEAPFSLVILVNVLFVLFAE